MVISEGERYSEQNSLYVCMKLSYMAIYMYRCIICTNNIMSYRLALLLKIYTYPRKEIWKSLATTNSLCGTKSKSSSSTPCINHYYESLLWVQVIFFIFTEDASMAQTGEALSWIQSKKQAAKLKSLPFMFRGNILFSSMINYVPIYILLFSPKFSINEIVSRKQNS